MRKQFFKSNLRKLREAKDIKSQAALAYDLRIHATRLSVLERGAAIPYETEVRKLSEFFNVEPREIFPEYEPVEEVVS